MTRIRAAVRLVADYTVFTAVYAYGFAELAIQRLRTHRSTP